MWYPIVMFLARVLYKMFRGTLKKAIDNPKRDWDERAMAAVDAFFGWEDKGKATPEAEEWPTGMPPPDERGEEIQQESE